MVKIPDKEKHRNPDGTYNGVSFMAEASGLSKEEIEWSWKRAKELAATGLSGHVLAAALKIEARDKFGHARKPTPTK